MTNDLLNTAPCGYLSFTSDGTILDVNQTLARWLDSPGFQLRGQSIRSILSMGGRVFYETHFWPQLELQGQIEEIYFSLRSKDGQPVPVLCNAARCERNGDTVYDCIFLRIHQRDQYEGELILAKKAAEQANRAKAEFLSMVSHELRTPLNAIVGFTEILGSEAEGSLNEVQQEYLKHIEKGGDDLLHLIREILTFAEVDTEAAQVKIEAVDVEGALTQATDLLMPRLQSAGLNYQSEHPPARLLVQANPGYLQEILLSLLDNAIQFTQPGGTVAIRHFQDQSHVVIAIHDNGYGIPEDQIHQIFEPFVKVNRPQFDSNQRGVGLGLAICRKMAQAMGGNLTATSTVGIGSIFSLSLPKAQ